MSSRVLLRFIVFAVVVAWSSSACLAGIRNVSATASVNVDTAGTNTVNDVPFRDGDGDTIDGGSATAAAGFTVEGFGTASAFGSISLSTSSSPEAATVSFNWSGDGSVSLENENPFKSIGTSSSGNVTITFEVVGSPANYSLSFPSGGPEIIHVSLSGGGVGLTFCHNDLSDCEFGDEDNLPRSGTLPPGFYRVSAGVSGFAGKCIPPEGLTCSNQNAPTNFNGNFSFSLSVQSVADFRWVNGDGGSYFEPENWERDAFPGANDTAIFGPVVDDDFNEILLYTVSANGAAARRFLIEEVLLDFDGSAEVFGGSIGEPSLTISHGGKLNLDNGARLTGVHGSVGFNPNTPGAQAGLLVSGAGSDATFSGRLAVGEFSDGGLLVDQGASVACAQAIVGDVAFGQADVNDAGSRIEMDVLTIGAVTSSGRLQARDGGSISIIDRLVVGDLAAGTLSLVDGGKASAGEATLGAQTGGVGTITLSGDGGDQPSLLEVSRALRIGDAGDGTLEVRDGSTVRAGELRFAPSSGTGGVLGESHVTVAGTDLEGAVSDLTVTSDASLAHGELDVLDGAHANFANLTLGSGGITEARIAGFGAPEGVEDTTLPATLSASRLIVGLDDFADLRVEPGGKLQCTELSVSSQLTDGIGRIVVNKGEVVVNGPIRVSGEFQDGDSIVVESAGFLSAKSLRLGDEDTQDSAELVVRNGTSSANSQVLIDNGGANGDFTIGVDGPGVMRLEFDAVVLTTGSGKVGNSKAAARVWWKSAWTARCKLEPISMWAAPALARSDYWPTAAT